MCTHLLDLEIVRVLLVVLLELWQLPWLPIMLMPAVDQDANSNQVQIRQCLWQIKMSDNLLQEINVLKVFSFCIQWNQCRLISRAFTVMVEGSIQHAVDDGRSMACSPCVGRRIFYACLSRAPRLGLSAIFGLPSNCGRSSRQCMASGIRKIISLCSYMDLGTNEYAWKTNRENPSLGTNSKLGTPKQLFSLALGPLWRSC